MKESRIKVRYKDIDLRIDHETYRELKVEAAKKGLSLEQIIDEEVNDWYKAWFQLPFHFRKSLDYRVNISKMEDREHLNSEVIEWILELSDRYTRRSRGND